MVSLNGSSSRCSKNAETMNDPEELEKLKLFYLELRAKLMSPESQAALAAKGLDPAAELRELDKLFANAARTQMEAQAEEDKLIQMMADAADASVQAYHDFKRWLATFERNNPDHPKLAEAKKFLQEWSERVPMEER